MTPIDKILEAFDTKWPEAKTATQYARVDRTKIKDFIRTSFASYNKELREKVEGMKIKLRDKHRNDGWADHELPDVAYNATLDDVLILLK